MPSENSAEKSERKPRSDKGKIYITERDLAVLRWIGDQYGIRLDQLQRLLGRHAQRETVTDGIVTPQTAHKVVMRWVAAGLVEREKLFFKQPAWIWLSREGLNQFSFSARYWKPSIGILNHVFWVNEVRLFVEQRRGDGVAWRSERLLKPSWTNDKEAHYADAEVELDEGTVGIEVEITRKKRDRIKNIMRSLYAEYATVWYFTNGETKKPVEEVLQELRAGDKVKVYPLPGGL